MKNIGASVSAVLTPEKKEAGAEKVEGKIEEEECIMRKNEVIFYLKEAPEYQISGVAEWGADSQGENMKELDTYFLHVLTGRRCESAWGCLVGWSEPDEQAAEKWETLCRRIEEYENIEQEMCDEKTIGV